MKRYVILTGAIRNAGGAQQYTANKLSYMESKGWMPYAFFFVAGEIKIQYLSKFQDYHFPELGRKIQTLSRRTVKRVISAIFDIVGRDEEIVIESNSLSLAFWGEILAERLNGKHVMFPLEESFWRITKREAFFFDFKIQRGEIMTGTEGRLKQLFQNHYRDDYKSHIMGLKAYCSNVVDYNPIDIPVQLKNESIHRILSIGRLKKAYITPMLQDIRELATKHRDLKFSLIMIGGDADPSVEEQIRGIFDGIVNLDLFLLGYMFPIPYEWIRVSDVCIASSNSVLVAADAGIPTIAIDAHDLKAIGVYGFTTYNKVFRQDEPQLSILDLLEDVLLKNKYPKSLSDKKQKEEFREYFEPHEKFLELSSDEMKYYSILNIYTPFNRFCSKLKFFFRTKL